jgi:hypothetical protein
MLDGGEAFRTSFSPLSSLSDAVAYHQNMGMEAIASLCCKEGV